MLKWELAGIKMNFGTPNFGRCYMAINKFRINIVEVLVKIKLKK